MKQNRLKSAAVLVLTLALLISLCACGKDADPMQTAQELIGQSAAELTEAIGAPESTSYASSCIGDGEDGEWYYDGFTVYTYRDVDGTESVYDVMPQA